MPGILRAFYYCSTNIFFYCEDNKAGSRSPGISPSSCTFSIVTLTFLIMSSSATRYFNRSCYSLRKSLRKNANVCWWPRIFSWTMLTTSDRAISADSKKLKSITLLKIGAQGSLSCSWYSNPDTKLSDFFLKFISAYHSSLTWCVQRTSSHYHGFMRARIKMK